MKYLVDKQKRVTKKRVMGIEPTYPAWKAGVLPLNYTRVFHNTKNIIPYSQKNASEILKFFKKYIKYAHHTQF